MRITRYNKRQGNLIHILYVTSMCFILKCLQHVQKNIQRTIHPCHRQSCYVDTIMTNLRSLNIHCGPSKRQYDSNCSVHKSNKRSALCDFVAAVHGARQEEVIDHRLTDREWAEEWKHLDNVRIKMVAVFNVNHLFVSVINIITQWGARSLR